MNLSSSERMKVALNGTSGFVRDEQYEAGQAFNIRRLDVGAIFLPTGLFCVADTFNADEFPPLNRIVPPGEYSAQIVIAELPRNIPFGNPRGAFLVIKFSDVQPTSGAGNGNLCG